MIKKELVIIGGGAGGLAAAISAYDNGVKDILLLEREDHLGGILDQCIHNGFGLTTFKEELTGPEYADRFIKELKKRNIEYKLLTQVSKITKNKEVFYSNSQEGFVKVQAQAIVLATGSYERTPGAIMVPGDRVSGIMTAGTAQKILNTTGYLVGKRIVILGSGDIGLIMARRLTLEGAKVICVAEIMPFSNGLNRNIVQCLQDFNIPLYLSTTVSNVVGKNRVEKVELSSVDENLKVIPGTSREIECDCLILSVGLLPQTTLLEEMGGVKFERNRGPSVDNNFELQVPGFFTCGNCLHVHDLVDFVSQEGTAAGKSAAEYLLKEKGEAKKLPVTAGGLMGYIVPNFVNKDAESFDFKFRIRKPTPKAVLYVTQGDRVLKKQVLTLLLPSIMVEGKVKLENLSDEPIEMRVDYE
ncbi:MAG: FAD-dependent oxidoreductase [Bacilli bacterium]|nr:FAD-dependent oxidoreductase [Bacilli bacterium]MBO4682902.1 FAD-dependent oxidoreductase [Bacilli bacterium]